MCDIKLSIRRGPSGVVAAWLHAGLIGLSSGTVGRLGRVSKRIDIP
ncbi:MAG: hypothetical protein QXR19_18475 [Candidatus Jordarchaeaceae archaeon]